MTASGNSNPAATVVRRSRAQRPIGESAALAPILRAVALLAFAWPLNVCAQSTTPDWFPYQVQFPAPPTDGSTALATLPSRAKAAVTYVACGNEWAFWYNTKSPDLFNTGAVIGPLIAKLQWLKDNPLTAACNATFQVRTADILNALKPGPSNGLPDVVTRGVGDLEKIARLLRVSFYRDQLSTSFGPGTDCSGGILVGAQGDQDPSPTFFTMTFSVTRPCLVQQINWSLQNMQQGDKQLGSSDVPCYLYAGGASKGEWDASIKDLIRLVLLDTGEQPVIKPDVRDHVFNDLISLDGPPGAASYSLISQCGNQERSTGTPQDRASENSGGDDFWDDLGDAFDWLWKRLVFIFLVLTVAGLAALAAAAISPLGGAALGAAVIAAGATLVFLRIPETENHRLMIESTRFLENQHVLAAVAPDEGSGLAGDQRDVREWLLERMQDILKHDFIEYNSRTYQEYSLPAIMNLADFSQDLDVKVAARMVLEYSLAKFAIGSNQGRRVVPFRRRMEHLKCIVEACPGNTNKTGAQEQLLLSEGADFSIGLGLLLDGQTQRLRDGKVSTTSTGSMIGLATSTFRPDPSIPDLAINKQIPYYQRIHHAGVEIYSSSPTALITAGGIETDYAYPILGQGSPNDRGAAVPITIMLTGPQTVNSSPVWMSQTTAEAYIQIRGGTRVFDSDRYTFEDNLCVWHNFACGTNLRMPSEIEACLVHPVQAPAPWLFFDSSACPYSTSPIKFYLVVYRVCGQTNCQLGNNSGFVEVVDAPTDSFDVFQSKVLSKNSNLLPAGAYQTSNDPLGHVLQLNFRGHADDDNSTGIISVDGRPEKSLSDWALAEQGNSPPHGIASQGDGVTVIYNARLGTSLVLNFSDLHHPCRQVGGVNQPCTQQ
jgi:hypothetical protein